MKKKWRSVPNWTKCPKKNRPHLDKDKEVYEVAKDKVVFVCSECGYESPKWLGKCPRM